MPTSASPAAVPVPPDTSPSKPAATEGSEAPANAVATPAAPPAPVDPIVEQLRELAGGKFDRLVGDKEKRAALDAFYSSVVTRQYGSPRARSRPRFVRDRLSWARRCRRAEPGRLRGAGCFVDDRSGEPRRGRTQAQRCGRRLCASRAGGTRALDARQRRYLLRHEGVGSGGCTGEPGGADVEIRRLAIECLRRLVDAAPVVFADFEVTTLADGSEVATSPLKKKKKKKKRGGGRGRPKPEPTEEARACGRYRHGDRSMTPAR